MLPERSAQPQPHSGKGKWGNIDSHYILHASRRRQIPVLGSVDPEVAMGCLPREQAEEWRNHTLPEQITNEVICQKGQLQRKDQEVRAGRLFFFFLIMCSSKEKKMNPTHQYFIRVTTLRSYEAQRIHEARFIANQSDSKAVFQIAPLPPI